MKLSIERGTLLKALAQAQSVVERRNTIPILANVLIEAEGAQVSFRATDLDIEVVDRAPAMVERPGATTVSAVMLHEIVRKLPDGALVTLAEDGGDKGAAILRPAAPEIGRGLGQGPAQLAVPRIGHGGEERDETVQIAALHHQPKGMGAQETAGLDLGQRDGQVLECQLPLILGQLFRPFAMQGVVQFGNQMFLPTGDFRQRRHRFHQRQHRRTLRGRNGGKVDGGCGLHGLELP